MTNFSMRNAARIGETDGGARVSKAISRGFRALEVVSSPMEVTREAAWALFCEWTQSDSLRKHVLGVEAAMVANAREFGEDEELWAATGILHDLDYERHPDLDTGHPRVALRELERLGYPQELIDAVAGHATFLGVPRETRMA